MCYKYRALPVYLNSSLEMVQTVHLIVARMSHFRFAQKINILLMSNRDQLGQKSSIEQQVRAQSHLSHEF